MNKMREEAVWQRVMAACEEGPAPKKPCPKTDQCLTPEQVMELLERALLDACTYRTLAGRVRKEVRRSLLQLAQEEQQQVRKLEAVYYLMTGHRPCPDRPKAPCVACTNEELRKRYQLEVESAARYCRLAEHAGSFAEVFHCLSRQERCHAQQILNLLQRCL